MLHCQVELLKIEALEIEGGAGANFICFLNSGTTDPEEPKTLPKRTIVKVVVFCLSANA